MRIRALITAIVLAGYSPLGLPTNNEHPGAGHTGHLAISLFIGRRTRVAASQQFEIASRGHPDVEPALAGRFSLIAPGRRL